jgi:hypothetical protein
LTIEDGRWPIEGAAVRWEFFSTVNRQSKIGNSKKGVLTMPSRGRLELSVLGAAVLLGILADALLRTFPWGLNCFMWMVALSAVLAFHARAREETLLGAGYWLPALAALFALNLAWRDSLALNLLSLLAAIASLALIILQAQSGQIRRAGFVEYALGASLAGLNAALGLLLLLFGEAEWRKLIGHRGSRHAMAALRGVLLALPCLFIFGGLFMGADAVFNHLVRNTFRVNFQQIFVHFFVAAFFAWCAGGYLRGMLWGQEIASIKAKRLPSVSLGTIEGGVALGALDLLFLAFVLVQVRYFFGGSALVQATTGLTYAEYARRGFFQLFDVAVLVLPLLLLAHWLMAQRGPEGERVFRVLAGVQIVSLFVVMASALERMRLYQAEYGLTEQRLYATAFMVWLGVVFLWFAHTVLGGRRERFAFGATVAGFILVIALNVLNPDALIARINLARAEAGRSFDARYAAQLSADAVPVVVVALAELNPKDRCAAAAEILKRWPPGQPSDWRTWNWSRSRAAQVVRQNLPSLTAMQATPCPPQDDIMH